MEILEDPFKNFDAVVELLKTDIRSASAKREEELLLRGGQPTGLCVDVYSVAQRVGEPPKRLTAAITQKIMAQILHPSFVKDHMNLALIGAVLNSKSVYMTQLGTAALLFSKTKANSVIIAQAYMRAFSELEAEKIALDAKSVLTSDESTDNADVHEDSSPDTEEGDGVKHSKPTRSAKSTGTTRSTGATKSKRKPKKLTRKQPSTFRPKALKRESESRA